MTKSVRRQMAKETRISFEKMYEAERQAKQAELRREQAKKNHKCSGCVWGSWEENTMYCMFASCVKERWDKNGEKR